MTFDRLSLLATVAWPEPQGAMHLQSDGVFYWKRLEPGLRVWSLDLERLAWRDLGQFASGLSCPRLLQAGEGRVVVLGEVRNKYGAVIPATALYESLGPESAATEERFWVDYELVPDGRWLDEIVLRHRTSTPDEYTDLGLFSYSLSSREARPLESRPLGWQPWFRQLPPLSWAGVQGESEPYTAGGFDFFWRAFGAGDISVRQLLAREGGQEHLLSPPQPEPDGWWWEIGAIVPVGEALVYRRFPSCGAKGEPSPDVLPVDLVVHPVAAPFHPLRVRLPDLRSEHGLVMSADSIEGWRDLLLVLVEDGLSLVRLE
ncbi:MAG: hypothetical protein ACOX6T_19255 [Myxococcales bacterium]|jgi:hypothetical protein